jgi:DNA-binding MarR family transcriptional regulator
MNNGRSTQNNNYRSLLLLNELAKGESLSQRDLSRRLNTALGLVNTYVRNLVSRGFVKIKAIPPRRYTYYLTPKGFTEKTRLTYHLLQEYTRLYREARRDFQTLFGAMAEQGIERVLFAGFDEITEIAYLSLQETDLEFLGVFDDECVGMSFFKTPVKPLREISQCDYCAVTVTTFAHREAVMGDLRVLGVPPEKTYSIGGLDPEADTPPGSSDGGKENRDGG